MLNPGDIYKQLVTLGEDYADKNAAADLLEENKKSLLSKLSYESEERLLGAKETYALRHPDYKLHLEIMVEARRLANRAKVKYDSSKAWVELLRTQNANERAANRSAT